VNNVQVKATISPSKKTGFTRLVIVHMGAVGIGVAAEEDIPGFIVSLGKPS